MVLLPEERSMTLAELRQMAARQQHQIEAQQQLLVAKEQRLKFLKQQEARHHNQSEQQLDANCLNTLRDKVEAQELKLRQLRALRGQVEQQKTNNGNLGTELESIRALFCEKEKELDLAVSKVEELTRQLDEVRKNNRKNFLISSTSSELDNLRRELLYQTKLSEQQNNYICQQRVKITNKQQDIAMLDQKINELNLRLHRKRLLNEQLASQVHITSLSKNSNSSIINSLHGSSDIILKMEPRISEVLEPEHSQDDLAANLHGLHKCDLGEFSVNKKDPKYQTLPYNTKFSMKGKEYEDSLSSSPDEELWTPCSKNALNKSQPVPEVKYNALSNFSPRPFSCFSSHTITSKALLTNDNQKTCQEIENSAKDSNGNQKAGSENMNVERNESNSPSITNVKDISKTQEKQILRPKPVKPAVPPKPAISVKPILSRDNNQSKNKSFVEQDSVNKALSVLKAKSSDKEKSDFSNYRERLLYYQCIPRYSSQREPAQDVYLPKSKILTYFSKTILQPEGGTVDKDSKGDALDSTKRKPSSSHLPIRPKPLTIRKTPGLEPPKLKVPQVNLSTQRKAVESQSISHVAKSSKSSTLSSSEEKISDSVFEDNAQTNEVAEVSTQKSDDEKEFEKPVISITKDSASETDDSSEVGNGKNDEKNANETENVETSNELHRSSTTVHNIKKGNLKSDGSIRGSRRVSFDPLALLLDAALEGELELVKKTVNEVVNPSAANDEGITALHNAICAGNFDVVKFLVEFGCDVNAQDSDGWTPLHCASSCNNLPMVRFLVERGACIFATTFSDQETAAEKCEEEAVGFDECSKYLYNLQDNLGIMNNGIVYAVYDYEVQNADELSFKNGDMLTVLRKTDDDESEWWWSRLNDEEGYVPRNLLGLYPRVNPKEDRST